jgi:hypothetical protein
MRYDSRTVRARRALQRTSFRAQRRLGRLGTPPCIVRAAMSSCSACCGVKPTASLDPSSSDVKPIMSPTNFSRVGRRAPPACATETVLLSHACDVHHALIAASQPRKQACGEDVKHRRCIAQRQLLKASSSGVKGPLHASLPLCMLDGGVHINGGSAE